MLLSRFFRSSSIRSETQSVSSIFSDWLVSRAIPVNEWPVWLNLPEHPAAVRAVVRHLITEPVDLRHVAQHALRDLGLAPEIVGNPGLLACPPAGERIEETAHG